MARKSTKENKNIYQRTREGLGLTREEASDLLVTMSPERIEITVDGQISGDELADFVHIQEELEKISIAVETLQLWCEQMLDTGAIDQAQYEAYKKSKQ